MKKITSLFVAVMLAFSMAFCFICCDHPAKQEGNDFYTEVYSAVNGYESLSAYDTITMTVDNCYHSIYFDDSVAAICENIETLSAEHEVCFNSFVDRVDTLSEYYGQKELQKYLLDTYTNATDYLKTAFYDFNENMIFEVENCNDRITAIESTDSTDYFIGYHAIVDCGNKADGTFTRKHYFLNPNMEVTRSFTEDGLTNYIKLVDACHNGTLVSALYEIRNTVSQIKK
ncbi:MAG: hypothetical protein EOM87_08740 [Clostridia bacterium]|nr:hypothetical protein [Clostridia bacterium]